MLRDFLERLVAAAGCSVMQTQTTTTTLLQCKELHVPQLLLAAASLVASGCFLADAGHKRGVSVEDFDVSPTQIAVGQSFEVTWHTRHSSGPGDIFKYGLYFAEPEEVEDLEGLLRDQDVPKLFSNGEFVADPGKITCTRTDEHKISCRPFGGINWTSEAGLTGEHTMTFTACLGYVLDDVATCESRTAQVTFL